MPRNLNKAAHHEVMMMMTMRRRHSAPCRFRAQVGEASHHHHMPKAHDFLSHPHERWNIVACGMRWTISPTNWVRCSWIRGHSKPHRPKPSTSPCHPTREHASMDGTSGTESTGQHQDREKETNMEVVPSHHLGKFNFSCNCTCFLYCIQ